jgi:hypothetical protein
MFKDIVNYINNNEINNADSLVAKNIYSDKFTLERILIDWWNLVNSKST